EPPAASLQNFTVLGQLGCGPLPAGTCVAFAAQTVVEVTLIDQFGQKFRKELWPRPWFTDLADHGPQSLNFRCIELRTRALNGALSEPSSLCREDGPNLVVDWSTGGKLECTSDGLEKDGKPVPQVTTPPSSSS